MKISIYDAYEISGRARKPFDRRTAWINICSPGDERSYLQYKPYASFFLVFDDTFPAEKELLEFSPLFFSERMAAKTVTFINSIWEKVNEIIC